MRLESNRYTFMFAFAVCVTCSLALSIVSEGLKEKKAVNVALDIKKNILEAVSLKTPLSAKAQTKEVLENLILIDAHVSYTTALDLVVHRSLGMSYLPQLVYFVILILFLYACEGEYHIRVG